MSTSTIQERDYPNAGPRITREFIIDQIESVHYFTALEGVIGETYMKGNKAGNQPASLGLLTFCVLVLKNGFTVTGESACASPSNFSAEIGQQVAYENAFNKCRSLFGFQLRSQLNAAAKWDDTDLGEALTRMIAHHLGNPTAFRMEDAEIITHRLTIDTAEEGGGGKTSFKQQLEAGGSPQ